MSRAVGAALALLAAATPAPAQGDAVADQRRFTAEALIRMEAIGGARVSRSGRWIVAERRGAYDRAATYAYGPLTGDLLTDLLIVDAEGQRPDQWIGVDDDAGYRAGPISPNGASMVVYRLTPEGRSLGVLTFATGTVRWFDISPELAVLGRTAAWRSDEELLVIATPSEVQPLFYRLGWQTQAVTSEAWSEALDGRRPSATFVASGRLRDRRPQAAASRLIALSMATGVGRVLASGEFFDLELAPDGRTAALLENAEDVQPRLSRLTIGEPTRRRRLILVDLTTGRRSEPAPGVDVMSHLLAWSPEGRRLLVFGRSPSDIWEEGRFLVAPSHGGIARPLDLGDRFPAVTRTPGEKIPIVRGGWTDDGPVLRVAGPAGDVHWWSPALERRIEDDTGVRFIQADGATWVETSRGRASWRNGLSSGWRSAEDGSEGDGGSRGRWNPASQSTAPALIDGGGCVASPGADELFCPAQHDGGRRLAVGPGVVISTRTNADGTGEVRLQTPAGERLLFDVNSDLADVDWGRTVRIDHDGPGGGGALASWLLLPPGTPPEEGWPLLVMIYPGHAYPVAPAMLKPGGARTQLSPLVFAAAGYAILTPSLPLEAGADGALADLASRIEPALAAALAQEDLDPDRVGLMGHSFGGRGALLVAAQTRRYRAVVASAAMADYGSAMRDTLHFSSNPADGVLINARIGYFETGQGGMSSLPWEAPAAYTAASPLYSADRIFSPVLLIHGDLDPVSAEAMFGALYRLDREAGLLTYRGEGHNLASPANIVDLHRRVLEWLGERLAPRRQTDGPPADPDLKGHADQDEIVGAR